MTTKDCHWLQRTNDWQVSILLGAAFCRSDLITGYQFTVSSNKSIFLPACLQPNCPIIFGACTSPGFWGNSCSNFSSVSAFTHAVASV